MLFLRKIPNIKRNLQGRMHLQKFHIFTFSTYIKYVLIFFDFQEKKHTMKGWLFHHLFLNILLSMSITPDMISQITPLSDRILLKPIEADNITASGIILPESANKERPSLYEVIAV